MLYFVSLFAAAVLLFHQMPWLPAWPWLVAGSVLLPLLWRFAGVRPWTGLLLGWLWALGYAIATHPPALPQAAPVLRALVSGQIVSLPEHTGDFARFRFRADSVVVDGQRWEGDWRLRLSWRDAPPLHPGQAWRLPVRLRAVHGYANPGGWDYEGWLYWQGIRYSGYVSSDSDPQRLAAPPCCWLARLRWHLSQAVAAVDASAFARGVVRAISLGDQSGLGNEAKALFRATGTSHLMAISGLHIGLLAGIGLLGVATAWRCLPRLCARIPARIAGSVAAVLAATVYALLAGFALPTQRALIMLVVFVIATLGRRQSSSWHSLALAMLAVLLWHPPSIISAGFWLSFVAVMVILAVLNRSRGMSGWQVAIRVQIAISLALWPVLGAFGMQASLISPLVNLLLVPLFAFVVVPFSLLGVALIAIVPAAGHWLLGQLGPLLDLVQRALAFAAGLPWPDPVMARLAVPQLLLLGFAILLLLAPRAVSLRCLALPLLLLIWLPRDPRIADGDFELHVLDVGQGLSSVVVTRHHLLVFDTGPEFRSGFATATAVLAPFLDHLGRPAIDRLLISHGDNDHAGGIDGLRERVAIGRLQSGEPARIGEGATVCVAGERWQWDGVHFEILHPPGGSPHTGNNASCVLQISNAAGVSLLTGDIEARVERQLVGALAGRLRSDVVVAPHHGSRSSSSPAFVTATRPAYVVYTAGWANRYGFPAHEVDLRWREIGAVRLNTAETGAIRFLFSTAAGLSVPQRYRQQQKRFWWHSPGSAGQPHAVSSPD